MKNLGIPPFPPKILRVTAACQRRMIACALLAAVTLAVYWPARHYQFVAYDDDNYIYNNQYVQAGLTWRGVEWAFVDRQANNWHPLTWLSHMLDCQLFGLHAGGPHLVNVAFHCANAVLLFLLLELLMTRSHAPPPSDFFWRNLFIAALFALHPLRVESVAWISERKDVLSGFFGLLALLCYAQHAKTNDPGKFSLRSSLVTRHLSLAFFTCSLLAKPTLVTLPLVMLLLDYWPLQRLNKTNVREKWPFFAIAAVFCAITLVAQQPGLPGQQLGLFPRLENIVANYASYLGKLLWPHNLSFLYLRPDTIPARQIVLGLFGLFCLSLAAWMSRKRNPAYTVGWLWFLIVLLPMCGIVSLGRLSIADRYTYFASIGFYLMLVWWLAELKLFSTRAGKIMLGIAGAAALVIYAVLSREQLAYWENSETLFNHALAIDPNNSVAQQNLHIYEFEKTNPKVRPPPPQ